MDDLVKLYDSVDIKNVGKLKIDIPKVISQVQSNLSNPGVPSDAVVKCFKLIDVLFDNWPDSFSQDINVLYPVLLVKNICLTISLI